MLTIFAAIREGKWHDMALFAPLRPLNMHMISRNPHLTPEFTQELEERDCPWYAVPGIKASLRYYGDIHSGCLLPLCEVLIREYYQSKFGVGLIEQAQNFLTDKLANVMAVLEQTEGEDGLRRALGLSDSPSHMVAMQNLAELGLFTDGEDVDRRLAREIRHSAYLHSGNKKVIVTILKMFFTFCMLDKATIIDLNDAQLTSIPAEIGGCENLQNLNLSSNRSLELTPETMEAIKRCPLQTLDLIGCPNITREQVQDLKARFGAKVVHSDSDEELAQ